MTKNLSQSIDFIKSDIGWWPLIFAAIICDKTLGVRIPGVDNIS